MTIAELKALAEKNAPNDLIMKVCVTQRILQIIERYEKVCESLKQILAKHPDNCDHIHNGWEALSLHGPEVPLS